MKNKYYTQGLLLILIMLTLIMIAMMVLITMRPVECDAEKIPEINVVIRPINETSGVYKMWGEKHLWP